MDAIDERRAIEEIEADLERAYPSAPRHTIIDLTESAGESYLHAPVRAFVPLLVRREVVEQLRHAG